VRRHGRSSSHSKRSSWWATATRPAPRCCTSLARYLHTSGRGDAALAELERAVELMPTQPPSPERAQALAALANGLSLAWRYDESLAICEQALALARAVG
jgi:tetratricopeptide (TPR) repeat protein